MKTYKNLLTEIQRLQTLAAKRRRKEVGAVIADIRQNRVRIERPRGQVLYCRVRVR